MKIRCFNISLFLVILFLVCACTSDEVGSSETDSDTESTSNITEGYVLYSYIGDKTTHLIDSLGVDVKTWSSTFTSSGGCYLSENKTLLRLGKTTEISNGAFSTGGLVAGIIEELDDTSNVIWSIQKASDEGTFHHDFKEIDANTIIALTWELRTYNNSEYWNEVVIIIDKSDNSTIWEWSAMDDGGIIPANNDKVDYLHFNSVDYKDGNILISSRGKNTLYLINKASKVITQSITASGALSGQHDATFIDNGNILVYNNNAETNKSAILEITLADKVVWSYSSNFYSDHISGTQRLESGNTLICSGIEGRFIEVTDLGDEVWDFTPEVINTNKPSEIFKIRKYADY
ncbi:arylsulfotransferase ASST [Mariniflexile fucanivorans]|uniref:Arylsulfotransferase ASST n=1 Tax=Mariniflexile fucanivorans TaxID=264023 RepID=A0A4R1RML2_9FLAO|nr:arylsulfotransferase family protein [Mariniflexile fucanivorans]TCL67521.1 arylsulfotransferase ASST [Mariniflexile fucanivorans]